MSITQFALGDYFRLMLLVSMTFCKHFRYATTSHLEIRSYQELLYGFSYQNLTNSSMPECLQYCLSDCVCLSFQMCGNTCQLCSATAKSKAPLKSNACQRFEFKNRENPYVSNMIDEVECGSCVTGINCCLTSKPCHNNGVCKPLAKTNARFTCVCANGYTGDRCTKKARSCRAFIHGNHTAGYFQIFDKNDQLYTVFCSFDDKMAWTLVQSFTYANSSSENHTSAVYLNKPQNEINPSWEDYRLSHPRMARIQQDSNAKWRLTCNFDQARPNYTDYVKASHEQFPLLNQSNKIADPSCSHTLGRTVELAVIRGHRCSPCNIYTAYDEKNPLHIDSYYSSTNCNANFFESKHCANKKGEDNFGLYVCMNRQHACSSSNSSTTQLWFGGD